MSNSYAPHHRSPTFEHWFTLSAQEWFSRERSMTTSDRMSWFRSRGSAGARNTGWQMWSSLVRKSCRRASLCRIQALSLSSLLSNHTQPLRYPLSLHGPRSKLLPCTHLESFSRLPIGGSMIQMRPGFHLQLPDSLEPIRSSNIYILCPFKRE